MEQDAFAQMCLELVELFNAGWSLRIAPSLNADTLSNVPVTISFKRPDTGEVHGADMNRYQLQQELPRVVHLFHSLVFLKAGDSDADEIP